jgi:hypothetical protein
MRIAETADGLLVGQVRFNCTPDGWEVLPWTQLPGDAALLYPSGRSWRNL